MTTWLAVRLVAEVALALGLYAWGQRLGQVSERVRLAAGALALLVALLGLLLRYGPVQSEPWGLPLGVWLGGLGGGLVPACLGACLLAGLARAPRADRVARGDCQARPALAVAAVGATLMLALTTGAYARWPHDAEAQANYADRRGLVRQTYSFTCGAAAGAMLLARHGIQASEGRVAELAGTSPLFGTDLCALAWSLDTLGREAGWRCRLERLDLAGCRALGQPCLVGLSSPGNGQHAVLLERVRGGVALVADPLRGRRVGVKRGVLDQRRDPLVLWLERR